MGSRRKWCAIDAEGDTGKLGLLGVAFFSDHFTGYITDHDGIRDMLKQHAYRGYTLIAHNAEYDLGVIFWQLHIPMKAIYYAGRFNRGEWRYEQSKPCCQLWDTLALSGGISLNDLGTAIGLPKLSTPQKLLGIDPDRFEWLCPAHNVWECEECYAVRDAEIIYRYMVDLSATLEAWGVPPKRKLSCLASHVWRKLDTPDPITLDHAPTRKLARESYHGGRTETYKLGTVTPCYTADVTSMYPWCMATTVFPRPQSLVYHDKGAPWSEIRDGEGVAEATVLVPPMYLPPLPYVHLDELHYPIGRLRGVWTIYELRYAETLGCTVEKVHKSSHTHDTFQPFPQFIGTLWAMREAYKASNDPRQIFAKLLLNNLYGYLGMKEFMLRKDVVLADHDTTIRKFPHDSWYTESGELFLTFEKSRPVTGGWTNVMWASQITSASRVRLHQCLSLQGDDLLYCDTDSVFSRAPIVGLSEGLGGLRPDGDYTQAIIVAPKLYAVQSVDGSWQAKAKGVSRKAALTFLREGVATFSHPIKPLSQSRRHIKAGTWVAMTRTYRRLPARRQPVDPSALYAEAGWSDTTPFVVPPLP